ncbi:MAG TPA: hypothetical protein DDW42_09660 [Desulfobacteraceae bacterium]|nr:hypothetical protein [Desulfobacteraceae bacterium]
MKIECPGCHKVYNIPDERLPKGKKLALTCPNCKSRIKLDLRSKPTRHVSTTLPESPTKGSQKKATTPKSHREKEVRSQDLKNRIFRTLKDLPSMPQVVAKAQEIIANPTSGVRQLSNVLETDQAIATKVLKIANSAYYGLSGRVSSIQHASVVLGYKTLEEIIIVAGSSTILDKTLKGYELGAGDLWRHSLAVAFGSRIIAGMRHQELKNDAFSAGLIHDVGKLVLDAYVHEKKDAFEEFMQYGRETFLNAEKHILGFDHSEIGFEICKHWHIPEALSMAIRYHHHPSRSHKHELAYIVYTADSIIHMADAIANMNGVEKSIDVMMYQIDDRAMEFLNLQKEDIISIIDNVTKSIEKIIQ